MIIVPVKEGENIEKALKKFKRGCEGASPSSAVRQAVCAEAPQDGARHLRTAASCQRGIKKVPRKFGGFRIYP